MAAHRRLVLHVLLILAITSPTMSCGGSASPTSSQSPTATLDIPRGPVPAPSPTLQIPTGPGPTDSPNAPVLLPDARGEVSGGGPLGGGDPAAKARISSQLPSLPQNIELTESEAVSYMQSWPPSFRPLRCLLMP